MNFFENVLNWFGLAGTTTLAFIVVVWVCNAVREYKVERSKS